MGKKRVIGLGCQRVGRYSTEIKEKVGCRVICREVREEASMVEQTGNQESLWYPEGKALCKEPSGPGWQRKGPQPQRKGQQALAFLADT